MILFKSGCRGSIKHFQFVQETNNSSLSQMADLCFMSEEMGWGRRTAPSHCKEVYFCLHSAAVFGSDHVFNLK